MGLTEVSYVHCMYRLLLPVSWLVVGIVCFCMSRPWFSQRGELFCLSPRQSTQCVLMNITNLLFRTHCSASISRSLPQPHRTLSLFTKRRYATQRDGESSSLLSQSLDTKQRVPPRGDSVGPFQLGLAQSSLRKGEKVQSWSQLSTGGKGVTSFITLWYNVLMKRK